MTEKNIKDFNNLTHGGIEHIARRTCETAIEPNYSDKEILGLLRAQNQYYMLTAVFLLTLMGKDESVKQLTAKRNEWQNGCPYT